MKGLPYLTLISLIFVLVMKYSSLQCAVVSAQGRTSTFLILEQNRSFSV
jgi:hypothetical protein